MIPVCHNLRRYANKVFAGLATDGKGTMGWCHGFKLHFICNDRGEIIMFCLTGANVDDRDPKVWAVLGKRIYGKLFADRGYISPNLFDALFDKIMLRKRYVIECINHLLKDKGNLVHSRHRSVNNFLMNLIAALGAYCFFDNKPEAIQGYRIEDTKQLSLF